MSRKNILFFVAFIGIISAAWAIQRGQASPPKALPVVAPAQKPYPKAIAAAGIIEALGENIAIGAPQNGVVQQVYVDVLQRVKKGDPLFTLDSCELEAELKVAEAKEEVAQAEYRSLYDQLVRLQSIKDLRATSQDELRCKENAVSVALATLTQMQREREKTAALLNRLTVRSPMDGVILQKSLHVGEYLVASNLESPPLVVGDISRFQIRTDVDEQNASHMPLQAEATAYPKNQPSCAIALQFVRIEPYVIPKTSLTGSSKEKVDTRVLQIIYACDPPQDVALYVGQQVDVYIERAPSP